MNEVHHTGAIEDGPLEGPDRERIPVTILAADPLPKPPDRGRRSFEPWLLGGGALLLLVGGLAFGASQLRAQNRQVMAISGQQQNFVPNVRVAEVRASGSTMVVSLPATIARRCSIRPCYGPGGSTDRYWSTGLTGHGNLVNAVAICSGNPFLASASRDRTNEMRSLLSVSAPCGPEFAK